MLKWIFTKNSYLILTRNYIYIEVFNSNCDTFRAEVTINFPMNHLETVKNIHHDIIEHKMT